jgi:hypothetical protein
VVVVVGVVVVVVVIVGVVVVVAVVGVVVVVVVVVDVVGPVVVVEVVEVVVVVVVGGGTLGTRTKLVNRRRITSGESTSWIRLPNTVIRHTVPAANGTGGVNRNDAAGDRLSENTRRCPSGHANRNDACRARTCSLKRTVNTERGDIDTDTTPGARSADADNGSKPANQPVPPATDTPRASPNGPASAAAATCLQPLPSDDPPIRKPAYAPPAEIQGHICTDNMTAAGGRQAVVDSQSTTGRRSDELPLAPSLERASALHLPAPRVAVPRHRA